MPRPIRFFMKLGIIVGAIYGGLFLVAEYWSPEDRQMEHYLGRVKVQN